MPFTNEDFKNKAQSNFAIPLGKDAIRTYKKEIKNGRIFITINDVLMINIATFDYPFFEEQIESIESLVNDNLIWKE